ncbi:MAG: CoA activase [Candidatus Coatesbacteria bacterium]|nr:CoA activase [Candidatus Coatesbacteria bacterium]
MNYYLGIDIGSTSIDIALINEDRKVLKHEYHRHKGQPFLKLKELLKEILHEKQFGNLIGIAITGSGGQIVVNEISAYPVNEVIAQAKATSILHPFVKTVIEIGGESAKLLILSEDTARGKGKSETILADFSMNTLCAAGTGSFLDQQASRLNLSIEVFSELALKSKHPPRIAGRCSVFAKSDMIHLQQIATPDYEIVAGLCQAVARNFKSTIGKGKEFKQTIAFQGGVAANVGMVRAFEKVLDLKKDDLFISPYFATMGAIGAVFSLMEQEKKPVFNKDKVLAFLNKDERIEEISSDLEKLELPKELSESEMPIFPPDKNSREPLPVYLGIDVGSISTNLVLIDEKHRIVSKRYLMTASRPIEAVQRGLSEIYEEVGNLVKVAGVGTTGSGRYLTYDFVGGDVVRNEITAQAVAAIEIDNTVDTIFEIGGQDSKYISIDNGVVIDFEMNKVCAAGTGSFLEEQAERLGINIKKEFSELALSSQNPINMGDRCTVFIETSLRHYLHLGAQTDNLASGLSYSIVNNYLNKVVGDRKIGNKIFFQGGTAFNKGVLAAFRNVTGKEIIVPPHHDVTGAIGAAILAHRDMLKNKRQTRFKGFDLGTRKYTLDSFECTECSNNCTISRVKLEGEKPLFYGSRCEKFEVNKAKMQNDLPDLFAEREKWLLEGLKNHNASGPVIGIPRMLLFHEQFPYWQKFFEELDFKIVLSDKTTKEIIRNGVESAVAETCFPVKVAHGHVLNLLGKQIDAIFLPSITEVESEHKMKEGSACPYVQACPYLIKSALSDRIKNIPILTPVLSFIKSEKQFIKELETCLEPFKIKKNQIKKAMEKAGRKQKAFRSLLIARGTEVLAGLGKDEKAIVVVSRPYNGCDEGLNLNIPEKLRNLKMLPIPIDFLPLSEVDISPYWKNMFWRYGQRILAASHYIKKDKRLFALYITNFGCGPDSFITHFFNRVMHNKPYLQLEIDEHSADAGAITRCEAFLDSIENLKKVDNQPYTIKEIKTYPRKEGRTIWVPYMCDHAVLIAAALRSFDIEAYVMPKPDEESIEIGRRYTSGRECFPAILTTGDMLKILRNPEFNSKKNAFLMMTSDGPCRFGQYYKLQRMVLNDAGYEDVPIISPSSKDSYTEFANLGARFQILSWTGLVTVDILLKILRSIRPYEVNKGESDAVYNEALKTVEKAIEEKRNIKKVLEEIFEKFSRIKTDLKEKPVIGVVGEIYVRNNAFSNDYIARRIEDFGGVSIVTPLMEWVFFTNYEYKVNSKKMKDWKNYFVGSTKDLIQKYYHNKVLKPFEKLGIPLGETHTEIILEKCYPYLKNSVGGEAILSVGKAIDYIDEGLHGIINVMPFSCLPGTIVSSLSKKVREDNNNIPWLNLAFDGSKDASAVTRLETFIYQAKQYMEHNRKERKSNVG